MLLANSSLAAPCTRYELASRSSLYLHPSDTHGRMFVVDFSSGSSGTFGMLAVPMLARILLSSALGLALIRSASFILLGFAPCRI